MRLALVGGWLAGMGCGRVAFDALPGDGPPTDDGGVFIGCPPFAEFCDDFEGGDLGLWTRMEQSNGTSLVASTARPHRGALSLDARVPALFDGATSSVVRSNLPQSTGMRAIRIWMYAPQAIQNFDLVLRLWHASTARYFAVGCDNSGNWAGTEAYGGMGPFDHYSTTPCVSGRWTCVELDYTFGQPHFALYVDNTMILDLDANDPAPMLDEQHVGAVRADAAGFQIVVDDVVIAQQHIGC